MMLSGGLVAAVAAALFVLGHGDAPRRPEPGDHTKGRVLGVVLELWGHFLLVLLCVNVAFDEFVCCPLLWIFVRPLSPGRCSTARRRRSSSGRPTS